MSTRWQETVTFGGLLLIAVLTVMGVALAAPGAPNPRVGSRHRSLTEGLDCGACHTPQGWKPLGAGAAGGGFDHSRTGFPLTGQHSRTACIDCHATDSELTRDCVGCHADAHQRQLGEHCDDCHTSTAFQDVRGLELHRLTRLPLTGMHALADCTACHQRIGDRRFGGVPADCYACHARDYRRTDIHPLHVGGAGNPPFPRDCGQCHRATGWAPAIISPSGSSVSSASGALLRAPAHHDLLFPISAGSHRGALCADCHRSEKLPRAVQCTGCHEHSPVRLMTLHRSVTTFQHARACLQCHPAGAPR